MGRSLLLIAAMGFACATTAVGQTLDGIRSEVREEKEDPSRKKQRKHGKPRPRPRPAFLTADYDDDEAGEESLFEGLTEKLLVAGLSVPFVAPRVALSDDGGPGFFPKYPYGKHDGSLLFDETHRGAHSSVLVLQGDYGSDFDSLSQAHGRIFGERDTRIGFDSEFFFRREELRPGTDELWHGDFNLTYRFAQSEHWQFRAGAGLNWLTDDLDTDFGFNLTYGAEWFPAEPWVLNSSLDWGRVGSTSLLHLRNTIGVTRSGWGIFTGHDYLRIGDDKIHSWITGIEYRF